MAHSRNDPDTDLRAYLHADLADFIERYERQALMIGDVMLASCTRTVHQARLDALLDGDEVRGIPRADLPDFHPESTVYGGRPDDRFTLGADDILRLDRARPPAFTPRRRNGDGDGQP